MAVVDGLRGSVMTETLVRDLGFKCADLRQIQKELSAERDPIVWQLRARIGKTCGFDAPIASALMAIADIEKKRAGGPRRRDLRENVPRSVSR